MNWYIKQIFAQATGLQNYIGTLGVSPDVINYILSLDKSSAQYLTNEIRKNPSLTLQQLQEIQLPQKQDPYLPSEKRLAANFEVELPQFSKWILVSLRKLRNGQRPPMGDMRVQNDPYQFPEYFQLKNKIPEIQDWIARTNPDIASYSPEQAIQASDEWHQMMAYKGEGVSYEATSKANIAYGPEWRNPEWNGWTIQEVTSENDLTVEGNKMNHCVGSYCEDVARGDSTIFSLRDPSNNPHVTIEIEGENSSYNPGTIKQIQGKSNSEPKNEYKSMIKEWISSKGKESGINPEINAFESLEENHYYESPSVQETTELLEKILQGEENEYGLHYIFDSDIDTIIDKLITEGESEQRSYYRNRDNQYVGDITEATPYVANLALMEDLKLPHFPRDSREWQELKAMPKESNWENIQKVQNWAWSTIDEITEEFHSYETGLDYPQEENFESPEEYEEAMEQFNEAESEIHGEWLKSSVKGGFASDLLDELKTFEQNGLIPSPQELYNIKKKKEEEEIINSPAYQEAFSKGQQAVQNVMEPV